MSNEKIYAIVSIHYIDHTIDRVIIQRAFKTEEGAKSYISKIADQHEFTDLLERTEQKISYTHGSRQDVICYAPIYFDTEEELLMSKLRPWGSMLEAQVSYGLQYEKENFDKLLRYIKSFSSTTSPMKLPYDLRTNNWISQFWWCLCRMYGETKDSDLLGYSLSKSYIPNENLNMLLDDLNHTIYLVS